jgi:hypothetical protein
MVLTAGALIHAGGAMNIAPPELICAAGAMNIAGEFTGPDY